MNYVTLPPEVREIAESVLTAQQYRAWRLYEAGFTVARVARILDVSRTRAKALIVRAQQILLERAA